METNVTTPEVKTEAAAAPVKAKRVIKTPAKKADAAPAAKGKVKTVLKGTTAAPTKEAPAPKVNTHVAQGVKFTYEGLSGIFNSNRKTAIMDMGIKRGTDELTTRHQSGLYGLRQAYGEKPFPAKGLDNGVMRDLLAAGLIRLSGGVKNTSGPKPYWFDAEKPVMVTITKAGLEYGKVAAAK